MIPTPSPTVEAVVSATTAPWWGVPLIAGLFLIVGGLIGGWISFVSSRAADRRRIAHENSIRWHADLRRLSAELLEATTRLIDLEDQIRAQEPVSTTREQFAHLKGLSDEVIVALRLVELKKNEITLIVPADIEGATLQFVFAVIHASKDLEDGMTLDEVQSRISKQRQALMDLIRWHLSAPGRVGSD